jgi:hypothetical protein
VKIGVRLVAAGVEETVSVGPPGMIPWERRTKLRVSDLKGGPGIDDLAFMAYCQLRHEGRVEARTTYEAFLATLEDLDPVNAPPTGPPDEEPSSG